MRYIFDNDLHIHSSVSLCSKDPEQTPKRMLQYAKEYGLKTICIADHFWDKTVPGANEGYIIQNYDHIAVQKPLPQMEGIRFLFGCETELKHDLTLGIAKENYDLFDFIVIPTTHFHMEGFTLTRDELATIKTRAKAWIKHFEAVLDMDLPFHKVGIAHLTCGLIYKKDKNYLKVINAIPDQEMYRLFTKAAKVGVGIELNADDMKFTDQEADIILRPYSIAKKCGCKFYCGSDAHHPKALDDAKAIYERVIDYLQLTEDDKFILK